MWEGGEEEVKVAEGGWSGECESIDGGAELEHGDST